MLLKVTKGAALNVKKLLVGATLLAISNIAFANQNVDKMTTYSVLLGRAIGCGMDVEKQMKRVGTWMDKVFPPGSSDQKVLLPIFIQGIMDNSKAQANGNSPDSCSQVRSSISKTKWP